MGLINNRYEHALACAMFKVSNRGLYMNPKKLAKLRVLCNDTIETLTIRMSKNVGIPIYLGVENHPGKGVVSCNLNSPAKLLPLLKDLGYTMPKIRRKNKESHEYEFVESTNDLVLQKILADSALWPIKLNFDPKQFIMDLIEISGVKKLKGTYVNARLFNSTYYSIYNVAASVTGRRGSRKHIFNLGNNAQNFPKHTNLSSRYRECFEARSGRIFFIVDQISAEDWPVQALAENHVALAEMKSGVNRHLKFASLIFGVNANIIQFGREAKDPQYEMMYYLGKKGRHSNNYSVQATTMSESLAAEGYSYDKNFCKLILDKINLADPNVQKVFHEYVKKEVFTERMLRTPLGRERQFFGLRDNDKNYHTLNEAYSYIPQSIVGDNTGLAILFLDGCNDFVVHDGHDSISQEVPDNIQALLRVRSDTKKAFDRDITFHNGITINIPIEGEIGYDLDHTVKLKSFDEQGLRDAYDKLKNLKELMKEESVETISELA